MFEINPWIAMAAFVATGLLILGILWPNEANGARLLKKWGVTEPTAAQAREGLLYLRRRRFLYPWLYAVLWFVPKWGDDVDQLVVVVLAGTLLAELLALRPQRDARREALLIPRGLFDFASKWVVGSYAVFVLGAAIYLVIHPRWTALVWLAGSVLAVGLIIWAAVARPAGGDQAVDLALRTRSVHVAAGLGVAVVGGLVHPWVGVLGLLAWISMSNTTPKHMKINR
ncbi:hypothetical protein [Lentzea kentuckyensis]|uniref:hypothetical protein n=1 Tax=Lentzea kentuckyensis TaxID=360086 RepID=UPI000A35F13B|nr:hypothetical protein [Lentzea kentuckyensis]